MNRNYRAGIALAIIACMQLSMAASEDTRASQLDLDALHRAVKSDPYLKTRVIIGTNLSMRTVLRSTYNNAMQANTRGKFWGNKYIPRSIVLRVSTAQVPSPYALVSSDARAALEAHENAHVYHLDLFRNIVARHEALRMNPLYVGGAALVSGLSMGAVLRRRHPLQVVISTSFSGVYAACFAVQGLKIKSARMIRAQERQADEDMMNLGSRNPVVARGAVTQLAYLAVHEELDAYKQQEGVRTKNLSGLYEERDSAIDRLTLASVRSRPVLDSDKQKQLVQNTFRMKVSPHLEALAKIYHIRPEEVRAVVEKTKKECINSIIKS